MLLPDYHVHTQFSPDSVMSARQAADAALCAGVTHLCFTEHMDLGHPLSSFNRIPDFDQMQASAGRLRAAFPALQIYVGLEAGYIPETAEKTAQLIAAQPLDYVLLSTHCVNGLDCYLPESKRGQEKADAYKRYLEIVYESVCDPHLKDSWDCVGHIGYIAKCGHYSDNAFPYSMFPDLFDSILAQIIKRGKGIEVNTSGIDKAGHVLPHPSVISRYLELGGQIITLGSDAHTPDRVGRQIKETLAQLRETGVQEIAVFRRRMPFFYPI